MASETAISAQHATLDADTVDTVTLGSNWAHAEVVNWGVANRIFFTTNGDTPTVGGDDTHPVGPNGGAVIVDTPSATPTVIKLICASANDYSVIGF